jgi:voltage-gated potassium channel
VQESAVALFLVIVVGVFGYMYIEGWSFVDALWMVVITLTTIGYGEAHPLSAAGRIFTIGLIVGGVSVGTYAMGSLTRALLEGELRDFFLIRRQRRLVEKLDQHYIVIGHGRLGRVVARELRESGAAVCVVEQEPELVRDLSRHGTPAIVGDGADDHVLREAGIERAKGVAVTTAPIAQAIFVTLSARQLNPTVPILTRVESDEEATKARRAGASAVVSPHIMGGWRMAHGLVRPNTASFLDLATLADRENIMIDEVGVNGQSPLCGRTLAELGVGSQHGVLVVAVRHPGGEMVPTPGAGTSINEGDFLIVVGRPEKVQALARLLSGPRR